MFTWNSTNAKSVGSARAVALVQDSRSSGVGLRARSVYPPGQEFRAPHGLEHTVEESEEYSHTQIVRDTARAGFEH